MQVSWQVCTFGAKCSPSVAQHIKNLNASKYKESNPRACKAVQSFHYVDDYLDSFDTEEEAIDVATQVYEIHKNGGFELRNWISNSSNILNRLESKPTFADMKQIGENNDLVHRVLGMKWNTTSDVFIFDVNFKKINESIKSAGDHPTKRNVLRTLMSTFDPLGLIAPYLVEGKLLMQNIWRSSIEWDEPINIKEFETWISWMKALKSLSILQIPRCYGDNNIISKQLHLFVDSSQDMYGAVIYMRTESIEGVQTSLISSKSKVAPLKPQSIPRLELLAAVLGVRLLNNVLMGHEIKFDDVVCWSDSRTVLCWLSMDPKLFKQFVALRVAEILECTEVQQWRWIPTKDNIADYLTKPRNLDDKFRTQWVKGPAFLTLESSKWPQTTEKPNLKDKKEFRVLMHVEEKDEFNFPVPKYESFSSWNRLVRSQAFIIRATNIWIAKLRKTYHETGPLKKHEIDFAEKVLYKVAQGEVYKNEIGIMKNKEELEKVNMLYKYSPFLDDDQIIRMKGRTIYALIPDEVKFPIILPKDHHITTLLVANYHQRFQHRNHETTMNELRQRFVIPKLRRVLQAVRKQCQKCKNENATRFTPMMAPLPAFRVDMCNPAFSNVGIDCFGPMEIVIGRRIEKRWGLIFTCLVVRAIHIEVLPAMSTDSFLMALKRFIARRGCPVLIASDNGTNFRGGANELREEIRNIDKERIQEEFANIVWKFNVPEAPHHGGVWERLIGLVKKNLLEMLKTKRPSEELLNTILVECENIINTRPLTQVPLDDKDEEPITPSHFLTGSSSGRKNLADIGDGNEGVLLKKRWRTVEQASREFWKKWLRDYLPTITRQSGTHK